MTISLFKYYCTSREDGTIASTYGEFFKDLLEEIFDTIGNEPADLYSLMLIIQEI